MIIMNHKILLFLLLLTATALFIVMFQDQFSLSAAKASAINALSYVEENRLKGALIFMAFYFLVCALPTPFVSVPTMIAGYLFGNIQGLLIVSFMSALGGTCLFLSTRYLLRDWLQNKAQQHLTKKFPTLQQAAETNNFMVALSIRLIPGMPFSIPAIALGVSQLSTWKFYLSTQLGLLAILFVYVNAGRSLAQINSVQDIFSLQLIASMLLVAIVPLAFGFLLRNRVIIR